MRKARNMFIVIVINIFLMLMMSVVLEFNNLSERLSLLENNIDLALDRSLEAATASEEFFTATYQEYKAMQDNSGIILSHGESKTAVANNHSHKGVGANMLLCDRDSGKWYDASAYILAGYYEKYHMLPKTMNDYMNYEHQLTSASNSHGNYLTRLIYTWLFGESGHSYQDYDWCNGSITVASALEDAGIEYNERKPSDNFKDFYDKIGKSIVVNGVVKVKTGDTYKTEYKSYPVLDNMGLDFGDRCTSPTADYMTDNFCMSEHAGKAVKGRYTTYFLTPYSLGVTYVPLEILKPVFMGNLDTIARLQRVSSGGLDGNVDADFASASKCNETSVYTGTAFTQQHHHTDIDNYTPYINNYQAPYGIIDNADKVQIVTDGNVEYVLNTVQMRVDYFTADFYDTGYKNIVGRIEGSLTAQGSESQANALDRTVGKLKQSDTYAGAKKQAMKDNAIGNRIVAKITVRLRVHILYQSSILQWLSYKDWKANNMKSEWHGSIKEIDPSTEQIVGRADSGFFSYLLGRTTGDPLKSRLKSSDGTWYQTSTYFAVTR